MKNNTLSSVRIEPLTKATVASVVAIYENELSQSFLGQLGTSFLTAFFSSTIESDRAFTLVAKKNAPVVGFATGVLGQTAFIADMIKHNPRVLIWLVWRFILHPHLISEALTLSFRGKKIAREPQLLSLGVSQSFQRQGVGTLLVKSVEKEWKKRDVDSFIVGTWETMKETRLFYEKRGGKVFAQVSLGGKTLVYYRYETA